MGKLFGFDFSIEYKTGSTNIVADALSCCDIDKLCHAHDTNLVLVSLKAELKAGQRPAPWSLISGLVVLQGYLYILPASVVLSELLITAHDDGHEGAQRTLHRLHRDFHSPNIHKVVQDYIRAYVTCKGYKSEHLHPAGLLLPLPVPTMV